MNTETMIEEARRLADAVEQYTAIARTENLTDYDDLLMVFERMDRIRQVAGALAREASVAAARLIGFNKQVTSKIGIVHTASQSNTKTDGYAILKALSTPMIDPDTGEQMNAIPTFVLEQILPAVGEGAVSSKWKKSGLKNLGLDVDDYIRTEYGPQQARLGPKPSK